jgi:glycosyltransferase involved in cell wall biosynthesis
MNPLPKVAVLMFSTTVREARVMRQVMALRGRFAVTVLGMGRNPFAGMEGVEFVELPADPGSLSGKILRRAALYATALGAVAHTADLWRHRRRACWQAALDWLMQNRMDVLIAHEPETAELAVRVKQKHGTRIILDLHEYSPRESDNKLQFRLIKRPHVMRILRRWGAQADGALTVNEHFCDLYVQECGLPRPVCILNAPVRYEGVRPPRLSDGKIHLIHHGVCSPARQLHLTAEALKTTNDNVVLHFMFADSNPAYLAVLEGLAAQMPGRIFFEPAVDYADILHAIAKYHVGVFFIPDNTFNHKYGLGNKFFDYLCAGMPLITGPNITASQLTRDNGFGWVTDDFTPEALARVLNGLTPENVAAAAVKADEFSLRVNAETEHAKLIAMIDKLLAAKA